MVYGADTSETKTRGPLYLHLLWEGVLLAEENWYLEVNFGATSDDPSDWNFRFKSQTRANVVKRYVVKHTLLPARIESLARTILGKRTKC